MEPENCRSRNTGEFTMVFPADLRNAKNLDVIAQNIEGIINVALRENLGGLRVPPPSINLRLAKQGGGEFIALAVSAKPFQLTSLHFED